jgi:hypothetical protein
VKITPRQRSGFGGIPMMNSQPGFAVTILNCDYARGHVLGDLGGCLLLWLLGERS